MITHIEVQNASPWDLQDGDQVEVVYRLESNSRVYQDSGTIRRVGKKYMLGVIEMIRYKEYLDYKGLPYEVPLWSPYKVYVLDIIARQYPPTTIEGEQYKTAPEGTIVGSSSGNQWMKVGTKWHGGPAGQAADQTTMISPRNVLRWGWDGK